MRVLKKLLNKLIAQSTLSLTREHDKLGKLKYLLTATATLEVSAQASAQLRTKGHIKFCIRHYHSRTRGVENNGVVDKC